MKYIIVRPKNVEGFESAIVFDEGLVHRNVARGIGISHFVVSAGFCYRDKSTGQLTVTGESESLKMKSRPEDLRIII